MSKEMLRAFEALEDEKGISKEVILEALEAALVSAYKRNYQQAQNVEVNFDVKKGSIKVFAVKEVVDLVMDSQLEVSLEDAHDLNSAYEIGDKIKFEVTPKDFGRIAAQTAKQVIMQRVREAERSIIYNEYIDYEDDILTGIVERQDRRYVYVSLGKIEAVIPPEGQIPNETFQPHERVQVYVERVENTTKGPQVYVSRSHPSLLKRLFEQEVPEIFDGTVEIKAIAREAGDRSKVAVVSNDANIDAVGTCVGPRGSRVQRIVDELKGENMDIVQWSDDMATFISNALNPADVLSVHFVPGETSCVVVVPENHLSLAIGKRGQNARLAAKLTNHKIDIKSEADFEAYVQTEEYAERFAEKELVDEDVDPILAEDIETVEDYEAVTEGSTSIDEEDLLAIDDLEEGNVGPEAIEYQIDDIEGEDNDIIGDEPLIGEEDLDQQERLNEEG
ncbi:transcription termination/antitermination protein NusA [Aerococcus sp. 150760007-1]|uniref:Transcription termination/antitermination protein NusA n=2 Tax=Aerococcus urinaeequi TaxID=51665 RepID=A0ABR5ZYY7_9LACT|nr:transcription termination factor NusA [Aerococcus urinaeequi]QGS36929.1 transcription termination/antitermination protein NusA [Aerococcus viridans]MBA5746807.1 transcription termination/antitermination protein NusA [Aerococcus urinaeequi]MBA5829601.1 transcription termination/antitermination protein NusA [Aerococcus urinaeequi]MBA5860600.1 transcription termination/antitermination protein NusA [Aerococcus urinaeequi]HCT97486.1 transcription termination/antitermination protein NusA [Aerococ